MQLDTDTIAAIATPSGKGGVGIIRLSGPDALAISKKIHFTDLKIRYAHFCNFYQNNKEDKENLLDEGIVLYFKGPHSFTGEDVVELQGHGGPVILDALLNECVRSGARLARPGEFSERAFLNDKLDLAQAEAIADLIDSSSIEAARNAVRSLQGDFSKYIHQLVQRLIELRIYVEAAIDFPEEEIDFLNDGHIATALETIVSELKSILQSAQQGRVMQEGLSIAIIGKPNAGKSSLLNALAGHDAAIVTDIEGTTRDTLKEKILIDGLPLNIIDTAGLRNTDDAVEKIGIERAYSAISEADDILIVRDATESAEQPLSALLEELAQIDQLGVGIRNKIQDLAHITIINNKCDLSGEAADIQEQAQQTTIHLSAKSGLGMDLLKQHIKKIAGLLNQSEGQFTARRRHLDALNKALTLVLTGQEQLQMLGAGELLAEDLRQAQQQLSSITGEFTADDLLGEIFSSFCIGK